MKLNFKSNLGFTLVELLVVIAIIGILSSVAVVNLNSARDKAKEAAIKETLASLRPVVILCFSANEELNAGADTCADADAQPATGQQICASVDTTWPDLQTISGVEGWDYCRPCVSHFSSGTYDFAVGSDGGGASCGDPGTTVIRCTQETCTTTKY